MHYKIMRIFQKGFNYAQDGPGNRLVYHIAGCNMHCLWCSNPEGMKSKDSYPERSCEDLVNEAISCKLLFFGGGGVTFTGGEATLDYEQLKDVLFGMKQNKIHIEPNDEFTKERIDKVRDFTAKSEMVEMLGKTYGRAENYTKEVIFLLSKLQVM